MQVPFKVFGSLIAEGLEAGKEAGFSKVEENRKRREEEKARIEGLTKPPSSGVSIPPPPDGEFTLNKFKQDKDKSIAIDSLQKIGGFVGGGAEMAMMNIAKEQLVELKTIATNTLPKVQYDDPGETSLNDGD